MLESRALRPALLVVAVATTYVSQCQAADDATTSVHDSIERNIDKEPPYESSPKYSLLVLDAEGDCKVWIVEDGERLYVDRNANGDLTDDGPPLEPTNRRILNQAEGLWDFDFVLDEFTPAGPRVTAFNLAHWSYGELSEKYGLSLTLNEVRPMYAGWFGLWSDSAVTAPVIHFGGKLQPCKLRGKEFVLGSTEQRLSFGFFNPGRSTAENARLSIDALPESVVPVAEIDWPVADGQPALRTTHPLRERCCYWEFYDSHFRVPEGVTPGTATVKLSISDAVLPFEFSQDTVEVPVRATDAAEPPAAAAK